MIEFRHAGGVVIQPTFRFFVRHWQAWLRVKCDEDRSIRVVTSILSQRNVVHFARDRVGDIKLLTLPLKYFAQLGDVWDGLCIDAGCLEASCLEPLSGEDLHIY